MLRALATALTPKKSLERGAFSFRPDLKSAEALIQAATARLNTSNLLMMHALGLSGGTSANGINFPLPVGSAPLQFPLNLLAATNMLGPSGILRNFASSGQAVEGQSSTSATNQMLAQMLAIAKQAQLASAASASLSQTQTTSTSTTAMVPVDDLSADDPITIPIPAPNLASPAKPSSKEEPAAPEVTTTKSGRATKATARYSAATASTGRRNSSRGGRRGRVAKAS